MLETLILEIFQWIRCSNFNNILVNIPPKLRLSFLNKVFLRHLNKAKERLKGINRTLQ